MPYLVANPEDRVSRDEAHLMVALRVGDLFIAFSTSSEALWGDVFPDLYGALSSKR